MFFAPPPPGHGRPVIVVGIAGGSGSGKTIFCEKLQELLEHRGVPVVALPFDMYYRDGPDVDADCGGDWDRPEALATSELAEHLAQLKAGACVRRPTYDFSTSRRDAARAVDVQCPPGGVVLVEVRRESSSSSVVSASLWRVGRYHHGMVVGTRPIALW